MKSVLKKIVFLLIFVLCVTSCKAKSKESEQIMKDPNEEKLEALFENGNFPFTNVLGEGGEIRDFILANKQAFLADLDFVLQNDTDDLLTLVDKRHYLESDFKPADLVALTDKTDYIFFRNDLSLRIPAEKALRKMSIDAKSDGVSMVVSSTFRSYEYQKKLFQRWVDIDGLEEAERESARAGSSQHQLGTAVDFGSITDDFDATKQGQWVYKNASKYGWSLSFPKGYESVTGYRWECWHFRYIGVAACRFQEKWFKNVQQYMLEFINAWQEFDM